MRYNDTNRPRSASERRDAAISLVTERKWHSEKFHNFYYRRLNTLYDLYRGTMRTRMQPFRNNAHIPLIFTTIQSDVAKKVETLFSQFPVVTFVGYGPDDAPYAHKQEALISAQFEDARILRKALEVFLCADLYGTAVIQYGWETRERMIVKVTEETLPLSGEVIRHEEPTPYRDFDGPNFDIVDLLDFFPQPGVRDIEEMDWVIRRRWTTIEKLEEEQELKGIYDASELARMEREGSAPETTTSDYRDFRFSRIFGESESLAQVNEPGGEAVEILEYWGCVPDYLAPDDVYNRVITIANGKYLLRNSPNPFWAERKPFLAYSPTPDPHHFFAIGKAEVIAKLQIVANRFTNQQLDVIDRAIDPAFIYNEDSGIDPSRAYLAPNKWIGMNGPVTDQFAPLAPDLRGVQLGTQKTQEIWTWMQQATGIVDDVVVGMKSGDNTAREYLGRSEAVAVRLMLEARLAEKMFIEPLADAFMALNKQFLDTPRELMILGDSAIKDPVDGSNPEMARQILSLADILPTYAARARGAASRLGKGVRQQNLVLLMQAASANPQVAGAINWLAFFRTIFREFEIENTNQLIATPEEYARAQQMAQGMAPPPALPGGVAQPGAQLPNQLGAQLG